MKDKATLSWLLTGDVSIQYQVHRDLLGEERSDLQERIAKEGWGKTLLDQRHAKGHWGLGYYQPKWTSSHYTLLDLRNLGIAPDQVQIVESVAMILNKEKGPDGGINPAGSVSQSDVCINGMMLNVCAYFKAPVEDLTSIIDFILGQELPDGGYNCRSNRSGAKHSSLHTTISVLEGFREYLKGGYTYKKKEVAAAEQRGQEFILLHKLYKSDRTGDIIQPRFLKTPYPYRWYYDILRALDYFAASGRGYDPRMQDAIDVIMSKKTKNGLWKVQAAYPGEVHVVMEKAGTESRWNTVRACRALKGLCLILCGIIVISTTVNFNLGVEKLINKPVFLVDSS